VTVPDIPTRALLDIEEPSQFESIKHLSEEAKIEILPVHKRSASVLKLSISP
jgi:hypothetical protein